MQFLNKVNQDFFDYWLSLPKDGFMPKRSDFYPEDIPALLPYMSIFELISDSEIKMRLAGTEVSNRAGFERTNTNYLDAVAEDRKVEASRGFWAVYNQPCATRVLLEYNPDSGANRMVEGVGAPVQNDRGGPPLLFYTTIEIQDRNPKRINLDDEKLELVKVHERQFIDIGAGLPDSKKG